MYTYTYILTLLFGRPGLIQGGGAWAIKESPKPVSGVSLPGEFQQQSLRLYIYLFILFFCTVFSLLRCI